MVLRRLSTLLLAGVVLVACDVTPIGDAGSRAQLDAEADHDGGTSVVDAALPDAAIAEDAGPDRCAVEPRPGPTGMHIAVRDDAALAAAIAAAQPGDALVLAAGRYAAPELDTEFDSAVFVVPEDGDEVHLDGLTIRGGGGLVFRGLRFDGPVLLEGAANVTFEDSVFDVGERAGSAITLQGQRASGPNRDIVVRSSELHGGTKATVFVLGSFAPSDGWNNHIVFTQNRMTCGPRVCFQLSGARDMQITDSTIGDSPGGGILTAGATRIEIRRNRFVAGGSYAMKIASPGVEWDDYDGVRYMVSSAITIANNLVIEFPRGVRLEACANVDIVHNTLLSDEGLGTWHRLPHDRAGDIILEGNQDIHLWNNVISTIRLDSDDPRPSIETHNLVQLGGGGDTLITDPAELDEDYLPSGQSAAVDRGLSREGTPLVDLRGYPRDAAPDLGALERGATDSCAP